MMIFLLGLVACHEYRMVREPIFYVEPGPLMVDTGDPIVPEPPTIGRTPFWEEPPPEPVDCDNSTWHTRVERLRFNDRQDCPWGEDDNLERRNGYNQARVRESRYIDLPPYEQLCELSIESNTDDLEFDDYFTFTLNEVILVGGGGGYDIEIFEQADGMYFYDWEILKGTAFHGQRYAPYYCIGGPESCVVPPTEQSGPFEVLLPPETMQPFTDVLDGEMQLDFALHTFGDNDNGDCAHTDMELVFTVRYVTVD